MTTAPALEAVLRPIVEGQLRHFLHDHPKMIDAVDWFKPSKDRAATFVNSAAKRILGDLLCPETRVRLIAACGATCSAPVASGGHATGRVSAKGRGDILPAPARPTAARNPASELARMGVAKRRAPIIAKAVQLRQECGLPVPAVWR